MGAGGTAEALTVDVADPEAVFAGVDPTIIVSNAHAVDAAAAYARANGIDDVTIAIERLMDHPPPLGPPGECPPQRPAWEAAAATRASKAPINNGANPGRYFPGARKIIFIPPKRHSLFSFNYSTADRSRFRGPGIHGT